jgi:all-trans-retinol 13,14-reductase
VKRAVVIGSGVGGLVSANLLAMDGWKVTVLEQHYRAGGCLHRFFRGGIGFDTGFHYVGSTRPTELLGRVLRHVGVYDALEWIALDRDGFDRIRFPGLDFDVPAGREAYRDRLVATFPAERDGVDRFMAMLRESVAAYGLMHLDLDTPPDAVLPWEERPLADVLDTCFTDPRIKAVLSGQAALYGVKPSHAPFGLHSVVIDHFLESGGYTIRGGGDKLALELVRKLRARGGRLELRATVSSVEVDGRLATAVRTDDGREFPAELVLANIHPLNALRLFPAGVLRPAYASRVEDAQRGLCHLGFYLQVDGDLGDLGNRNMYAFRSWDVSVIEEPARPGHVPFYFLATPGLRDATWRSGSERVAVGLVQADWKAFLPWEGISPRPGPYTEYKEALLKSATDEIRCDFPGWRIAAAEASTPLTTQHYTRSPEGAIYGHYHSVSQMGRYRFPVRTRVRNFMHVGQCVGFPGICGAAMSAYVTCGEVLGLPRLVEELRNL